MGRVKTRALTPPTLTQILPALESARLDMREILAAPNVPIRFVYFPLTGLVSLINTLADGMIVEVITIGREGMVGLPLFLRAASMPLTALVQVPGEALRMDAEAFDRLLREGNEEFRHLLSRYTQALFNQLAQHVVCNRLHPVEQRCAHWLLLTHDRVARDEFPLTHQFLAQMLGVRRTSVMTIAGRLQ